MKGEHPCSRYVKAEIDEGEGNAKIEQMIDTLSIIEEDINKTRNHLDASRWRFIKGRLPKSVNVLERTLETW